MYKKIFTILIVILFSSLSALNYAIFIFPNSFAPSGVDGICTMIQDVSGINIGYLSLILNIPLVILAFFFLNRDFALKSTIYVISFSLVSIPSSVEDKIYQAIISQKPCFFNILEQKILYYNQKTKWHRSSL